MNFLNDKLRRKQLQNSIGSIARELTQQTNKLHESRKTKQFIKATSSLDRTYALEMAYLCRLVYVACEQGATVVQNLLKFGHSPLGRKYQSINFFDAKQVVDTENQIDYCGLVACTSSETIVALRGTKSVEDWLCNLQVTPSDQGIHSGFEDYANRIWNQLQTILSRGNNQEKIILTGHSLGGAAAYLIADKLQPQILKPFASPILETYTFGAPPVDNGEIKLHSPLYRLRNSGDLIPYAPQIMFYLKKWLPHFPELSTKYCHAEPEYMIDDNYQIYQLSSSEVREFWQQKLISRRLLSLISTSEFWSTDNENNKSAHLNSLIKMLIRTSYAEHSTVKYIEKLNFGNPLPELISVAGTGD